MRYGSFGDLAILKNVSKIYLIWWFKIFLTLLTEDKFVRFYLFIGIRFLYTCEVSVEAWFCHGLCWPATPSETVCVGRIQTISGTTDMCYHLVKRSWRFKEDRWQFFWPKKNEKKLQKVRFRVNYIWTLTKTSLSEDVTIAVARSSHMDLHSSFGRVIQS